MWRDRKVWQKKQIIDTDSQTISILDLVDKNLMHKTDEKMKNFIREFKCIKNNQIDIIHCEQNTFWN